MIYSHLRNTYSQWNISKVIKTVEKLNREIRVYCTHVCVCFHKSWNKLSGFFFCFQRVILPPCGKEGRAKTTVPDSLGDHGIKIYSSEDMKTALQILANKYKWMNEWK